MDLPLYLFSKMTHWLVPFGDTEIFANATRVYHGWKMKRVYFAMTIRGRLAYPIRINRIQEIAPALFTGRKSRANLNKPARRTVPRHLRFRKGRGFIYRNFRRGTWRGTRGITRVSVCVSCTLASKLFG